MAIIKVVAAAITSGRARIRARHAEGNIVEAFDRFPLDIKVEVPIGRGRVAVAINGAGLSQ